VYLELPDTPEMRHVLASMAKAHGEPKLRLACFLVMMMQLEEELKELCQSDEAKTVLIKERILLYDLIANILPSFGVDTKGIEDICKRIEAALEVAEMESLEKEVEARKNIADLMELVKRQ